MFNSNWLSYCNVLTWNVPYYKDLWWYCWYSETWKECNTLNYLIFQDNYGNYHYFKLIGDNSYTKKYIEDKVEEDSNILCE